MKLIRIIVSLPIIFIGNLIALGGSGWYFVGCFLGLIGGYIMSKTINHDLSGLGWLIIGLPIYCFAMLPTTYGLFYSICGDSLMAFTAKQLLCMFGSLLTFIPFRN
jgi:hypothetical protein